MPSSYRVRVAAVLALLLCLGTLRGAVAFETKTKSAGSLTTISRITTKNENGQIAAIIEADGPLTYKTFSLHKPERVVLDLTGARSAIQEKGIEVSSQRLERIRVGAQDSNGVRIVFDVKEQCQFQVQTIARGLAIYFSESAKMSNTAQKADAKKTVAAPPTAPPDTTGLVTGSAGKEKKETKEGQTKARNDNEQVAKVETKKDSAEGRVPSNLPSVKGPAARPGITRAAARPAAPATAPRDRKSVV